MPNTPNVEIAKKFAKSWTAANNGLVGLSMPNADGGPNGLPTKPFKGRMTYPTIKAVMELTGKQNHKSNLPSKLHLFYDSELFW